MGTFALADQSDACALSSTPVNLLEQDSHMELVTLLPLVLLVQPQDGQWG